MKVNVISVTYNSASTVIEMLESLRQDTRLIWEVIIVDNGSTDGTREIVSEYLREHSFGRLVESDNVGFAAAYKIGGQALESHDSSPTLCINPDVVLAAGTLRDLVDLLRENESALGVITGPLRLLDGSPDSASIRTLPTVGKSALYAVLGKFTPHSLRYNSIRVNQSETLNGVVPVEATTGALMLVNSKFRRACDGIFDCSYWMYGEDLQLCLDAQLEGWQVGMAKTSTSIHVKGVSSGRPRSRVSNRAFHEALSVYYRKNLAKSAVDAMFVDAVVRARYLATEMLYRRILPFLRRRLLLSRSS